MKIATWNVNSIKARLEVLRNWLDQAAPDVVCLQEIKTQDHAFIEQEFESRGYNCAVHGQKSYNGVAILSKRPLEDVICVLPESEGDDQARYIEALVPGDEGVVRVASIYAPNGNPTQSEKFPYKLAWLERLHHHFVELLANEEALVLMGDYNIIPQPEDCYDPKAWEGDALFRPESRAAWRRLTNLGLVDATRACHGATRVYTYWDYQGGAWAKNNGLHIDRILLSPQAADRLKGCGIDRHVRAWEKPSDHVPVWCEITI